MELKQLKELIQKFKSNTISDQELQILKEFVNQPNSEKILEEYLLNFPSDSTDLSQKEKTFEKISNNLERAPKTSFLSKHKLLFKAIASAAILVLIFTGYYLVNSNNNASLLANNPNPIIPGNSKAKIVLENGAILDLESLKKDTIINLDGYAIEKDIEGNISYLPTKSVQQNQVRYNTLITPRGGEYKLNLMDGTTIWVNSDSKIKYPLTFNGNNRQIELEGEAYFKVSKFQKDGKHIPFIVKTETQILEVLGTSFNINAYTEYIKTTLVEGSVKLNFPKRDMQILSPNQESAYHSKDNTLSLKEVDPYYTIAWKEGNFAFDNAPISEVMGSIARWYDVDIEYHNNARKINFSGTISKYEQIDKILKTIELTQSVKFKIQGRRIIVM